jgi:hypothetical protein
LRYLQFYRPCRLYPGIFAPQGRRLSVSGTSINTVCSTQVFRYRIRWDTPYSTYNCRRFHPGTHAAHESLERRAVPGTGMLHGIIQEARRGSGLNSTRSGYHLLDVTTPIARRSCALDLLEHAERPAVWEHFLQVQYADGAGPGRTRRCM